MRSNSSRGSISWGNSICIARPTWRMSCPSSVSKSRIRNSEVYQPRCQLRLLNRRKTESRDRLGDRPDRRLPITRSLVSWMPKADAELEISWEREKSTKPGPDSLKKKLSLKVGLISKVTFPFLRSAARLSDTIEVTGAIALEFEAAGKPDVIASFEFDDIINFPKFENVFKFHDPKLEWNISKSEVTIGGEFDFGKFEKAGTIEVEFSKKDSVAAAKPDSTNLQTSTNSTTGSPGSAATTTGTPALPSR